MHISKSRFVAGHQCHRLLWWKVHEPDAVELQPDKVLQDRFDQGAQVGELARREFPGGTLIDLPHRDFSGRVNATREAMSTDAPSIYEASFLADDTFVAVDVLLREGDAWRLVEVKSSNSQKDEHITDAAVQLHVLESSGLDVSGVEIMHLNREYRNPGIGPLFARADVTADARRMLPVIPNEIAAQLEMLAGPLPDAPIGINCHEPRACPFMERCWPQEPHHIRNLYNVGKVACDKYMKSGVHSVWDIPPKKKLPAAAQRQLRAMKDDCLVVEPTLTGALASFNVARLGFLDFETIARAIPVWPGMSPWGQDAAQYSYHEAQPDGTYTHSAFLAEGPEDARPALARAMIDATRNADKVVMYSAFEKTRIRGLQQSVPELRDELVVLEGKLVDLLPVIRENVYHPAFLGSFSIKKVLPALVPGLSYDDLVIVDGLVASVEIARLLFVAGKIAPEEHARVRKELLDYCERDTWAMVKLLETLRGMAGMPPNGYPPLRLA